jgi:transcriptional regulator with XRE-family HTH domain
MPDPIGRAGALPAAGRSEHSGRNRAMGTHRGFGELLRQYRAAAGLSQEELTERSGQSARGIADLERGARVAPYPRTLRKLADAHAARLLGAASHAPDPEPAVFFRLRREADVTAARDQLGAARFEAAFAEGARLRTTQGMTRALADTSRPDGSNP